MRASIITVISCIYLICLCEISAIAAESGLELHWEVSGQCMKYSATSHKDDLSLSKNILLIEAM